MNTSSLYTDAGMSVLVVDDDPTMRMLATFACRQLGMNVEQAHNGFDAVERARQKDYDVILMDVHMPHQDGITTARKIREFCPKGEGTVILAFTTDTEMHGAATAAGMDYNIPKIPGTRNFAEILTRLLKLNRSSATGSLAAVSNG